MNAESIIFSLPGHEALGDRLASALEARTGSLEMRRFPDGETYVRGQTPCEGLDAILAVNLYRPDEQFLPMVYAVQALRVLGASRVILVSPYLPYMRQDTRFKAGEVVTSRIFAKLLSKCIDGMVTIDPHLHRFMTLNELYTIPTRVEHAAPAMAAWIKSNIQRPLIVGPDSESEQWVRVVADMADAPFVVLEKTRHGDRDVDIVVPPLDRWRDHTPVLVDDIISTGHTMVETIGHLRGAGYVPPVCVGVHAVFAADAYEDLQAAGSAAVVTCNTVEHRSNQIDLTDALVRGVRDLLKTTVRGCCRR